MSAALQIWSHTFCKAFDRLPPELQKSILRKIDEMGARLDSFPHHRLTGRPEYRLRVGDYRVLYEVDAEAGRLFLHTSVIDAKSIGRPEPGFQRTAWRSHQTSIQA